MPRYTDPQPVTCFLDRWNQDVDLRMLLQKSDWLDYLKELEEVKAGFHVGLPERYPCIVASAWIGPQLGRHRWVHRFADLNWFGFLELFKREMPKEDAVSRTELVVLHMQDSDDEEDPMYTVSVRIPGQFKE